jgi:hypothetical protein
MDRDLRRLLLLAGLVGVGLGALSLAGDRASFETVWRLFAIVGNLAGPWVLAALLLGRRAGDLRSGAAAGGVSSVVGVAGYYLGVLLSGGDVAGAVGAGTVWLAVAVVIGPLIGACGAAQRHPPDEVVRLLAVAFPAAALIAEGIWVAVTWRVWVIGHIWHTIDLVVAITLGALGLVLPVLVATDRRRLAPT